MTTHELATQLLNQPDAKIVVRGMGGALFSVSEIRRFTGRLSDLPDMFYEFSEHDKSTGFYEDPILFPVVELI